jgi:hypothetical protein
MCLIIYEHQSIHCHMKLMSCESRHVIFTNACLKLLNFFMIFATFGFYWHMNLCLHQGRSFDLVRRRSNAWALLLVLLIYGKPYGPRTWHHKCMLRKRATETHTRLLRDRLLNHGCYLPVAQSAYLVIFRQKKKTLTSLFCVKKRRRFCLKIFLSIFSP